MEAPAFFAKMKKAMIGLQMAMAGISLPALAIAIVVGLIIAAIVYLWNTNEDFRKAVINIWENIKKTFLTTIDVILHIDKYWALFKIWLKAHWAAMMFDIQQKMDKVRAYINEKIENVKQFWQGLKDKVAAIWDGIKQSAAQKMEDIVNWVNTRIDNIKNNWNNFKNTVTDVWNNVGNSIRGAMENIYNWVTSRIQWLGDKWHAFKNGMAEGFGNIATRVADVFKGVINNVIGFINSGINKINALLDKIPRLPDALGGGGIDFRVPPIQPLARGGIVDSPTLSLIGEAGKEAVVPLENTSFVTTLANAVGNAVRSNTGGGQGNSGDITVVLKLNELELGKAVTKAQNSYNRLNGNTNLVF
jgi:phage-related protein